MPSNRAAAAPALPRWISDPAAADFATAARLAFEATAGDGLAGWSRPYQRLQHALDLVYGRDQWPSDLAALPTWPGGWRPGRPYDPALYDRPPGGPPADLRAAVEEHQAEDDARARRDVARNVTLNVAQLLLSMAVPARPYCHPGDGL